MKRFKNVLTACLLANIYCDTCVGTKVSIAVAIYAFGVAYIILKWMDEKSEKN